MDVHTHSRPPGGLLVLFTLPVVLDRVLAEEECRKRAQRGEIRDKDQRIRQLRRLKERAVEESREQAFATASLREELR